jgi:hypothetical protein
LEFCWDDKNFDANFDGKFDGNFDGNLMGNLMMDSKGWPYDSFDCLLLKLRQLCPKFIKYHLPHFFPLGIYLGLQSNLHWGGSTRGKSGVHTNMV